MDLWAALERRSLTLDQTGAPLHLEREDVERFYAPLARALLARFSPGERKVVAAAGPPGSGKSAFAAVLAAALNLLAGQELAVCAGQDGWHFPNRYLESHFTLRAGQAVPLRAVKGSPETFDFESAAKFVEQLRSLARIPFPVYSRVLHEPVPDGGAVEAHHRIVILEGNYWLLDELPWRRLQPLFDARIFLTAGPADLTAGLMERHLRGGKTTAEAELHIQNVDLPNIERVLNGSFQPDVRVEKAGSRSIARLDWISPGWEIA